MPGYFVWAVWLVYFWIAILDSVNLKLACIYSLEVWGIFMITFIFNKANAYLLREILATHSFEHYLLLAKIY